MVFMITTLLAIYGALVATFTVGWNVYRDFSDRARLNLSCILGYLLPNEQRINFFAWHVVNKLQPQTSKITPLISISFTNTGKRSINVLGWAIKVKKQSDGNDHFVYKHINLPKLLQEGQYTNESTDDIDFIYEHALSIYAWDSTGKHWPLSKSRFNNLKHEIEKYRNSQKT
jgi:hypothetical protein